MGADGVPYGPEGDTFFDFRRTYVLSAAMVCVVIVALIHRTKKERTDAWLLRESLWGLQFKPHSDFKLAMIVAVGTVGLLAIIVHAARALGQFASVIVFSFIFTAFRRAGMLAELKRKIFPNSLLNHQHGLSQMPQAPLPVWVLTGFLGSGKTTLVNRLVRAGGNRLLVIENEAGDTRLDAELVIGTAGTAENVILINDGCACCKVRGDLCDLLRDEVLGCRHARGEVDGLIIECSGLADPAAVAQTFLLDDDLKDRLDLREVIAVVDAAHAGRYLLAKTGEGLDKQSRDPLASLLQEQIAFSSIVLLNKVDSAPSVAALNAVSAAVRDVNKTAEMLTCNYCDINVARVLEHIGKTAHTASGSRLGTWQQPSAWSPNRALVEIERVHLTLGGGESTPIPTAGSKETESEVVRCVSVHVPGELDLDDFNRWVLVTLKDFLVMRAKGVLAVAGYDQKLAFQAVHAVFHGTPLLDSRWKPGEARYSEIVLIGRELRPDLIEYGLNRCRVDSEEKKKK